MKTKDKKIIANPSNKRESKPKKHKNHKRKGTKSNDSIYALLNVMVR